MGDSDSFFLQPKDLPVRGSTGVFTNRRCYFNFIYRRRRRGSSSPPLPPPMADLKSRSARRERQKPRHVPRRHRSKTEKQLYPRTNPSTLAIPKPTVEPHLQMYIQYIQRARPSPTYALAISYLHAGTNPATTVPRGTSSCVRRATTACCGPVRPLNQLRPHTHIQRISGGKRLLFPPQVLGFCRVLLPPLLSCTHTPGACWPPTQNQLRNQLRSQRYAPLPYPTQAFARDNTRLTRDSLSPKHQSTTETSSEITRAISRREILISKHPGRHSLQPQGLRPLC